VHLPELAALFLRLGATSFGGPAAHVAMMEDEVVRRRAWMSREEFLDLVGASQLIPGPNPPSSRCIGYRRAGVRDSCRGVCFILPAWRSSGSSLGVRHLRRRAAGGGLLAGVKPVVLAVIVQALRSRARSTPRSRSRSP
jgi:chromate transporter